MGRIRFLVASTIASSTAMPSSLICRTVCSTSKIALLTTIPVKITKPSIVSISRGCLINWLIINSPIMPPAAATGTAAMITKGSVKERNRTTSNNRITPIAMATFACIAVHVSANALAAPLTFMLTFLSRAVSVNFGKISDSIFAMASSSAIDSSGRNRTVRACLPPRRRIDCSALTIWISAS